MTNGVRKGVVQNGQVELSEPLELPDGSFVLVLPLARLETAERLSTLRRLRADSRVSVSPPLEALSTDALYED